MITKDQMSLCFSKSPNKYHKKHIENSEEKVHVDIEG